MWECPFHAGCGWIFIAFKVCVCVYITHSYIEKVVVLDTHKSYCVFEGLTPLVLEGQGSS